MTAPWSWDARTSGATTPLTRDEPLSIEAPPTSGAAEKEKEKEEKEKGEGEAEKGRRGRRKRRIRRRSKSKKSRPATEMKKGCRGKG